MLENTKFFYISEELNKDTEIYDPNNINLYSSLMRVFCPGAYIRGGGAFVLDPVMTYVDYL